jgi:hypothetical protein
MTAQLLLQPADEVVDRLRHVLGGNAPPDRLPLEPDFLLRTRRVEYPLVLLLQQNDAGSPERAS